MTANRELPTSNIQTEATVSTFRLRRRTPGTFVLVPCSRIGRSIRCQGQLEAAAAVILANCPTVESIQEQPLKIHYAWREETSGPVIQLLDSQKSARPSAPWRCTYIVPDFLVRTSDSMTRLIEVKPADKLQKPDVLRKLSVAQRFADQSGWRFQIVTERELKRGSLLGNLRRLSRYRRLVANTAMLDSISAFVTRQPTSLACACAHFALPNRGQDVRAAILHLVATGRLDLDPRFDAITDSTLLHPGGSILWEPFDSVWGPSGSRTVEPSASSANSVPINSPSST
jgi:hypothetical protein